MKAVVLCAGMGSRLKEYTLQTPKPMLPLCQKPLLQYTFEYLKKYAVREIAINLHYFPEKIREFFGDGASYGVKLQYFFEPELLGTAGALSNMREWLSGESYFLVLYGDILCTHNLLSFEKFHINHEGYASLLLHRRKKSNSIVEIDRNNRIAVFLERPTEEQLNTYCVRNPGEFLVNSGIQILSNKILDYIPNNTFLDLPRDIYIPYFETIDFYGCEIDGFRIAIDSPERYHAAEQAIANQTYSI